MSYVDYRPFWRKLDAQVLDALVSAKSDFSLLFPDTGASEYHKTSEFPNTASSYSTTSSTSDFIKYDMLLLSFWTNMADDELLLNIDQSLLLSFQNQIFRLVLSGIEYWLTLTELYISTIVSSAYFRIYSYFVYSNRLAA